MPTIRLQRNARLAVVLITAMTIMMAFFADLLPSITISTAACPSEPPQPLRLLYQSSELIVVARVRASMPLQPAENGNALTRTALEISRPLKGDTKEPFVYVDHWVWEETPNDARLFPEGETVLAFLKRGEESDAYQINDYRFGVKKLSAEDLKIYVSRIEELAAITRREKPDMAELVEWLVRCAEEPATRWEGAIELAWGADTPSPAPAVPDAETPEQTEEQLDAASADEQVTPEEVAENEETNGVAQLTANSDTPEQGVEVIIFDGFARYDRSFAGVRDPKFAQFLNNEQKERLRHALFNAEEWRDGEALLLELAQHWGDDERLVPFVVKHLQRMIDKPPYESADLMTALARALKDSQLIQFAADYRENSSYEDIYFAEADEDPAKTAELSKEELAELAESKQAADDALRFRREKLRAFLSHVELAQQQQQQQAKRQTEH